MAQPLLGVQGYGLPSNRLHGLVRPGDTVWIRYPNCSTGEDRFEQCSSDTKSILDIQDGKPWSVLRLRCIAIDPLI